MDSNYFNLFGLLEFASQNPQRFGAGKTRNDYSTKIKELLKKVPDRGGWYFWGRFNDMGWWETVYLGMTTKGKTASLKGRLSEELKDEAIFLWASVYGREAAIKQQKKRYVNKDYDTIRPLRKIGAYFVIWVAADASTPKEEIKKQEQILIRIFRPTHNAQRGGRIKADELTEEIEKAVAQELKRIRGEVY